MINKIKTWCNADVTVNCLWYYVLLGMFVLDIVVEGITWLI